MIPKNRETEFGTVNEALRLTIYFEGQEIDKYETYFGALSTSYIIQSLNCNYNLQIHLERLSKRILIS